MIRQGEIQKIAAALGLRDTQIEKDYVIGWVLKGISQSKYLKANLVFKGGTSLRKIYFRGYRLSEDLDFTYAGDDFNVIKIMDSFNELINRVIEESRINLSIQDETGHATGNYNFYLAYTGPLGGKGENKKIKIDISSNEILCSTAEKKIVINVYSDLDDYQLPAYILGEIIAEKMRSLMQRTEPRDLYDLWYLFEREGKDIEDYIFDFKTKAKHKKLIPAELIETVYRKEEIFRKQWENRLINQAQDLPNFDKVWRELGKHWRKFDKFV